MPRKKTSRPNKTQLRTKPRTPMMQTVLPPDEYVHVKQPKTENHKSDSKKQQQMTTVIKSNALGIWLQTWLPIIFSGLVFVVIVVQAYISQKQWEAMSEQLALTSKQVDEATFSQRAYVAVNGANVGEFKIGERTKAKVVFVNAGNTPAYNVDIWANISFREEPIFEPILAPGPNTGERSKGIIAPHETMEQFAEDGTVITSEIMDAINQKRLKLYVWGMVRYDDIFRRTSRWTRFCLVQDLMPGKFAACENNNEAN